MGRRGGLLAIIICACCVAATPAAAAPVKFHPRVHGRLGLIPMFAHDGRPSHVDVATGPATPVVYHGGSVMAGGITVHTIFWAPSGYAFEGSPASGVPTYEQLVQQFFTDAAHDSGAGGACTPSECNAFTVLPQYAEGTSVGAITPNAYQIAYAPGSDSIDDTDPYPAKSAQCASPAGTATCITDGQVTAEIDHVIQSTPGASRGLHDLWYVFLPPGVDECITPGVCGTSAFAAYHAQFDLGGHGLTIYAVSIDPIIEGAVGQGADPQGFPTAESAIDGADHETVEAMTDPTGTGWMDPNGFEVADKCESPQWGSPLGYSNGSPYNQVINSHHYLIQEMWANQDSAGNTGCVQSTSTTGNQLPRPQVNLTQFSSVVSGNVNTSPAGGIGVRVSLVRADPSGSPVVVARASTTTASDGSWSLSLGSHGLGDDRDEVDVDYSGASAPQPNHQIVLTGNGGDPVNEAGWTGWSFLDAGASVSTSGSSSTLTMAPCGQTGVLSYTIDGVTGSQSPTDLCNTQTDTASVTTSRITPKDVVTTSSNDNRAFAAPDAPTPNLLGGLVKLTVPVGEPGSVSEFGSPLSPLFTPSGLPNCAADLELDAVFCQGLVPNETYAVIDRSQHATTAADDTGSIEVPLAVHRGDSVSLSNGSRILTTLHVARLRVDIEGDQASVAAGSCQPGDYYGSPPDTITPNTSAGSPTNDTTGGTALTGQVCPLNGDASDLPTDDISQTDDLSGGQTDTEVPDVLDTSPIDGETVSGAFTALAESGLVLPDNEVLATDAFTNSSLKIVTASRGASVYQVSHVNRLPGAAVPALKPGNYFALWTLTDANGDRRFVATRFIAKAGRAGAAPRVNLACGHSGSQRIVCRVDFPGQPQLKGTLKLRLARGGTVVGLGRGHVSRGRATVNLRVQSNPSSGAWAATLVLTRPHLYPVTIHEGLGGVS